MFVTYVLYSEKFDKIYIGYTSDLINRFHSHNSLAKKGYSIKFRDQEQMLGTKHKFEIINTRKTF